MLMVNLIARTLFFNLKQNNLMKKIYVSLTMAALTVFACTQEDATSASDDQNLELMALDQIAPEQCGTMSAQAFNLERDPSLQAKYDAYESLTKQIIENKAFNRLVNGVIEIPVVYHVIYRSESENLPEAQLLAQLDALNDDFNLNNPGRSTIPAEFQGVESNVGIKFVLENIIRVKNSKKRSWRPDDSMKFSSSGGSNVVNPQEFLNVWVVNQMPYRGGQILGYAQFPGGSWSTDGVVLASSFVGGTDRTLTHEVGHWLNLRHIWGDGGCGVDDFVADTPLSDAYNRGCPTYPDVSCGTTDMTMNFMDYTADSCMNMFTEGQKDRMLSVFSQSGGFRATMAD